MWHKGPMKERFAKLASSPRVKIQRWMFAHPAILGIREVVANNCSKTAATKFRPILCVHGTPYTGRITPSILYYLLKAVPFDRVFS